MRRSLVLISSVVMLSASTGLPPASASAQSSSPGAAGPHIAYVHDELGRLEAVIDPSQGVARYRYDAVGNITAIERPNLTDVSVIEVTPDWGVPGDRVTIEGTEFDGDIASDRVTFGGIAAVVESASGTSLVARIPAGAVTGPITVTTPAGFATSTETFTVGSRAPAVTAVEPTIIHTGESLTITGRNLGSDPASLDVAAGRTHLRVEHSDGSSVAAFAPAATGSGRVSVSTPWGQADGPDLFVIPDVFPVEQIGVTARALQGVPLRLAVPPGAIAVILTDASAGTRLTLDVAEAAGTPTQLPISLFDGRSMAVQNATPFTSTWSTAGLHESGTYTILVDGTGSTIESPITLTVVSVTDPVVTIGSDRAPAVISLTRPGQHAVARFAGRAGDRVTLIADPVDPPGTAELRDPFGMLLASGQGPGIVMGPIELASDGGYTVIYTPFELAVGQVSLEVVGASPEESVAARTDGQPVQLDLPTPGQAAHVSFDGGKGARIAIVGAASGGCFDYTLDGPDGVIFAGATWCDGAEQLSEPLALPQSGTYDLSVTGEALVTGSVTVRLFEVTDAIGTIIPNGPALQVEFEVPGQNAGLTFPAVAGATYDVRFENIAVPRVTAQIVAPDGNVAFGNELDPAGLTASVGPALVEGDYIINLDPAGTATGSIEVSVTESSPGALHGRVAVVARGRAVKSAISTVRADATGSPAECPHVRSPSLAEAVLPNRWTPTMPEAWSPGADALKGAWTTGRPPSPWERVPLEQAGPGVTSLAGRVLRLHGLPLARVRLSIGPAWTCSDPSGRFLLSGIPAGIHVLRIDGGTADIGERHYGTFDTAVTVLAGATTPLPFTVWMPLLDETNSIRVPQRLRAPLVLMSPLIPGLTITIPVGASIRDASGRRVHSLTITPVPVDRAPFPTPSMGTFFPVYFTVQPAGLVIEGGSARIVYPNTTREPASRRAQFFSYEPGDGWESYGDGTVSRDGRSVVPSVGLRELVPAAMGFFGDAPENAPKTGEGPAGTGGEPVDLASGLFVEEITDLYLPDVIPIALERTYRTGDEVVRGFGIGASTPYEMFLTTRDEGRETKLVLADGEVVSFRSIGVQPGVGQVWEATTTPGTFLGARIFDAEGVAPNAHWQLVTVDGTRYLFGHSALLAISDPNGNTVTVSRPSYGQAEGPVTQVTSPNGRWFVFAYEDPLYPSLVTRVSDDAGRVVRYEYDEKGRLIAVTDPMLGTTLYAYDDQDRRTSVTTPRGIHFLRNVYDQAGRVSRQIQADGSLHTFTYTTEGGRITATDYTDPRGTLRHVVFDATGWVRSATYAVGLPEEQTWAWERQPGSGLLTAEIDGLARRTEYAYDSVGRLLSTTRLAGTPGAVSTSRVYDPITGRLAAMRDEAGHRTSVERDQRGLVTGVADASGRVWSIESDDSGALVAATDPSGGNTRVDYRLGEPTGITDGTGHTVLASYDAAGRLISVTDPTGNTTEFEWDALDRSVGRVDALGGRTTWKYDPDGNLVSVTDPLGNTTTYTYSDLQWLATKTDPLGRNETYDYDPMGLLRTLTDPSGQVTSFTYDPVYRLTRVHFGGSAADPTASSTIDYTWDSDDELLSATDSVSGRISRTYDRLGQLVSETTPQGSIAYTYDAAGRRSSMTVDGTSATAYGWDDAGRLTEIARGPVTVDFAYDAAGRIETIAQPNDVTTGYAYDPASQVTAIAYRGASGTIGDLAYARAPDGRIVNRSGSLAGTLLPDAMTAATYDPAGQLTRWGDHSMRYDPNGNLLTDGTRTLTWDSRGQLTGIAGATAASFAYDAFGRRVASTVSGATATYRYDGLNAVSRQVGNGPTTGYVSGLGLDTVFASSDGTTGIAFMRDHLGSTIGLVGPGSSLDAKYTYEPYGRSETNHDDGRNTIRFTGREDDGTGLLYYRARHMDPVTGRFLSPDPITFDGFGLRPRSRVGTLLAEVAGIGPIATALGPERGLPGAVAQQGSAYAYVGSDPLSGRDPTGAIFPLIAVVVVAGWTAWRGHVEASCGSTALGRHCPPSGGGGGGGPGPGGGGGPGPGGGGGGPGSGGDTGPGAGYGPVGDLVGGLLHGFGFGGDDPSGGQDPGVTVHT